MDVKIGDKILLKTGFPYNREEHITKVIKVTPTGRIRVEGIECQFDKEGYEMGKKSSWDSPACIQIATEEDIKRVNDKNTKTKCLNIINDLNINNLTLEQAEGIIKILEG